MDFKTDQLNYKAVTYSSNAEPMTITEQSIPLVKQTDGSYNLPPNKILVKVHSAALNPVDLILYKSASKVLSYYNSQQGVGRDYSGTIVAIGEVAAKKPTLVSGTIYVDFTDTFLVRVLFRSIFCSMVRL